MARRRCEFGDSRLRRSPPDRASAVPYGQGGENAWRFPHLAHRSAAAHKLHSAAATTRIEFGSGKRETISRPPALAYSPRKLSNQPGPPPWCLLKRPENLTDKQRIRLRDLLRYNLQSVRAYLLKEEFQQLWEYESPAWAGKFLDQWCTKAMRSRIDPLKKFARTVRAHRDLLLNYFHARKAFSSGIIEGLNNKAKVTMRKAYGFRTFRVAELSLFHVLGKLPEPELAHDFY